MRIDAACESGGASVLPSSSPTFSGGVLEYSRAEDGPRPSPSSSISGLRVTSSPRPSPFRKETSIRAGRPGLSGLQPRLGRVWSPSVRHHHTQIPTPPAFQLPFTARPTRLAHVPTLDTKDLKGFLEFLSRIRARRRPGKGWVDRVSVSSGPEISVNMIVHNLWVD
jgi:hypothetical protein